MKGIQVISGSVPEITYKEKEGSKCRNINKIAKIFHSWQFYPKPIDKNPKICNNNFIGKVVTMTNCVKNRITAFWQSSKMWAWPLSGPYF